MDQPSQFNTPELEAYLKLQQQNQQVLMERLMHLESQVTCNSATSTSVTAQRKKICLPEKYDGDRKTFRTFMSQIELLFRLHPSVYHNGLDKVGLVSSLLVGRAATWCTPILESADSQLLDDYEAFKQRFSQAFDDPHRKATAFDEISKLRQANRDLVAYTSEFQRLACELDWSEETLVQYYRRGLQDEIRKELIHFDTPATLLDMISLATRMDSRLKEYSLSRPGNVPHNHRPKPQQPIQSSSNQMEIGSQRRSPLTDQEKQRRRSNNLCMYCGDSGHDAFTCPRKTTRRFGPKA